MLLLQAVNRNMLLLSTVCFLWVAAVNASFSQTFYTPRLVDSLNNPRSVDSASILPHTDRLWKDGMKGESEEGDEKILLERGLLKPGFFALEPPVDDLESLHIYLGRVHSP